ncbi:MAG: hypothetical protein Q9O24_10435 [Gammaproteobacteria bacterium]|nr:hypothetical protein [Gammaproteobacteria bacterium]
MENNSKFEELTSSVRHFERIIRTIITVQEHQGKRIRLSIRIGMLFLGIIGIGMFLMLYTVSTQMNQVATVIAEMNQSFEVVDDRMHNIRDIMKKLEVNVARLPHISQSMPIMESNIKELNNSMKLMRDEIDDITVDVTSIQQQSVAMHERSQQMSQNIQRMTSEVNHMAQPARTLNRFMPFP